MTSTVLCLSNHTTEHPQTDFYTGTIVFTLPPHMCTSAWTHVALESLNANIEPIIRDSVTVGVGGRQQTRIIDANNNLREYVQHINQTVNIDPLFTLLPNGHVRVTIAPPVDRVIINERLSCCLGLQETVLSHSFDGPFRADSQFGIAPLIVCAPKLVPPAHDAANQGQMNVLKILPGGTGRYANTFNTDSPLPLANCLRQDVTLQFCSPAYPTGIPLKNAQIYATLRLTDNPDDI